MHRRHHKSRILAHSRGGVLLRGLMVVGVFLAHANAGKQASAQSSRPHRLQFVDESANSGIDFVHQDGSSGRHYLVEVVACGMASFDYDLDGATDVYFLNGSELPGTSYSTPPQNAMFRNLGGFRFQSASEATRLGDAGFGLGVTVGDIDNDGFPDVYITNFGANILYRNNGDGTFSPDTSSPDLACGNTVGGGACMLDIDADGDLDIYAASYIDFDYAIPASTFRGRVVYGGPLLYDKTPDNLLENLGDGTFRDISQSAGVASEAEWGMGTICFDYDQDGDTDIFVANDSTKNLLWNNDGTGKFTDVALLSGAAYDHRGDPQGSMGIDVADYNNDLLPDLFQTAYTKQLVTLYENVEGLFFEDSTLRTGAGKGTLNPVNWGTSFVDFDNDGDKDLFIANGHIHDNMDDLDDTVSYKIVNQILENRDGLAFIDVSENCGSGLLAKESSRASVADDFDNDGRVDLIVLNSRERPSVIRNVTGETAKVENANWLEIALVGVTSNRNAVGSQVLVTADGRTQLLEVHSGRGYQSHFGSRLHFGVGSAKVIEQVEVRWHGRESQIFTSLEANQLHTLVENSDDALRRRTVSELTVSNNNTGTRR